MNYKIKHIKDWLENHSLIDLEKLKSQLSLKFKTFESINSDELKKIESVLIHYGYISFNDE